MELFMLIDTSSKGQKAVTTGVTLHQAMAIKGKNNLLRIVSTKKTKWDLKRKDKKNGLRNER